MPANFPPNLSFSANACQSAATAATAAMCRDSEDAGDACIIGNLFPVRVPGASVSAGMAAAATRRAICADGAYSSRPNLCLPKECGVVPFIRLKKM